jgi:CRP/FNR family cyclic AMP-dependent transcriptional regulator
MPLLKTVRRWFSDPGFARKKAFLRSLDIFKDLRDRDLGPLVSALHSRTYKEGEEVFVEGDIGRALFILEDGRVELTRRGKDGKPETLYTLKPGDFFGEMALLESLPRSATAVATERSHLHLLYRTKLDALLSAEPRIGVEIMSHLARLLSARLRRLTADYKFIPPRKE